jgi:uncharacterized protein YndB with AHSA1/START domain
MLKIILIGIAVVAVALVALVALQPAGFRVVRSATIAAPAPAVFAQVNDLHNWEAWSPWAKLDPAMTKSYEGAAAGVGAIYSWSGDKQVGEGRTTITESRPDERIRIKLEFVRPFTATNDVEFTFAPEGDNTVVTWSMTGRNSFVAKAVGLFMNMDKMVGGMFEQGLAQLKTVAETAQPQ